MSMSSSKKRKTPPVGPDGAEEEEWLVLNLSGTRLMAKRATLTSVKESMLARMFDPDSPFGFQHDESGAILLERDAEAFQWILGVLRRGGAVLSPPPQVLADRIRNEADYFGLDGIVQAIDKQKIVEQKIETENFDTNTYNWDKNIMNKVEVGWTVKSITCTPMNEKRLLRTIVLERTFATASADNTMHLYLDGKKKEYAPAAFGAMRPVSALTARSNPYHMFDKATKQPSLRNAGQLSGKVVVVERDCRCSFLEKARLVQNAGAVALVVTHWENCNLERMDASAEDGAADIHIPVLLICTWNGNPLNDGTLVELCTGGPRR